VADVPVLDAAEQRVGQGFDLGAERYWAYLSVQRRQPQAAS
jgi:hypothetical protein